jgi:hypothetical protein
MKALFPAFALIASALSAHAQDADAMIKDIRLAASVQKSDLSGDIRKGGAKTPLTLFLREGDIQFELGGGDRFHIRMGDEKCTLLEIDPKTHATSPFPSAKLSAPVAGTDLTYEDLTLRFLYWPNAKLEGEEKSRGEDCYKVRLDNPGKEGSFGVVYVWIHRKYGAFWTIKAYDRKGEEIKEFDVLKVMKLPDGTWTLQQMEIDTKAGGKIQSTSYLEFDEPGGAKKPKGLSK